jgi:hypothetical protein
MARTPLLTEAQVAERLGLTVDTVRQWRYDRSQPDLPWQKLGAGRNAPVRYRESALERFIDACQVTP